MTIAQTIDISLRHTLFSLWMPPQRDSNPVHTVVYIQEIYASVTFLLVLLTYLILCNVKKKKKKPKISILYLCPDGGSKRFYNRDCRKKQWPSSKQPHNVFKRKNCLTHHAITYLFSPFKHKCHILIYTNQINSKASWALPEALMEVGSCLTHTFSSVNFLMRRKEEM